MKPSRLNILVANLLLVFAIAASAQAKGGTVTIRAKAVRGHIEFSYRGKKLTDPGLDLLCATSRRQKVEIDFQRDKMNSDDTIASLLREAQCLGSTHVTPAGVERHSEPKSSAQMHAKHRRKVAAQQ